MSSFIFRISVVLVLTTSRGVVAGESKIDKEALSAFNQGISLFRAERYKDAADAFRRANELKPNWKLLYNIGQSEAAAKRHGLALEAFESYLSKGGDDIPREKAKNVESEIERLRKIVGYIRVSAKERAIVYVNDVKRGETPLHGNLMVAASIPHRVRIDNLPEQTIVVAGGQTATVVFDDSADDVTVSESVVGSETEPATGETPESRDDPPSRLKVAGFSLVGTGAAVLVGGAVTGTLSLIDNKKVKQDCPNGCYSEDYEILDRRRLMSITTDVLIGVGSAFAATGIILVLLNRKRQQGDEKIAAYPVVTPSTGALFVEWRF